MLKTAISRFTLPGLAMLIAATTSASATPTLVIDTATGAVLQEQEASRPWYPASLTKLMTAYVALKAVREGRITMETPMVVSNRAARMPPSKMAFKPGSEVTLDNALKMLMVKSANDLAVTIAEGVSGTVEDFAVEMNREAARLRMRDSHFVNPNGLHDNNHVSSARDMAMIGVALLRDFPESHELYGIGALRLDNRIIPTHNGMLGRYPGADGMKTGFTCAAGFNVVSTATRGGRKLMVVVMGASNAKARTLKAMSLLETAFNSSTWGRSTIDSLPYLGPVGAPNMRPEICGKNRNPGAEEDFAIPVATSGHTGNEESAASFFAADNRSEVQNVPASLLLQGPRPAFEPIEVFAGRRPGYNGPVARPRGADPTQVAAPKEKPTRVAARPPASPRAAAKPEASKAVATLGKPSKLEGQKIEAAGKPKAQPQKATVKPAATAPAKPAAKPKTQAGARPAAAQIVAAKPAAR